MGNPKEFRDKVKILPKAGLHYGNTDMLNDYFVAEDGRLIHCAGMPIEQGSIGYLADRLNNKLAGVVGYLEMAEEMGDKNYVGRALGARDELRSTTQEILTLHENGQTELEKFAEKVFSPGTVKDILAEMDQVDWTFLASVEIFKEHFVDAILLKNYYGFLDSRSELERYQSLLEQLEGIC